MNDRTPFERQVADRIAEEPRSIPLPSTFIDQLNAQAGRAGQRPRWLALLKEPPMRTNSRLAVGSPTARVAAVLAATFLLAVALAGIGVAGQRLFAADGVIVVAQDGSGIYQSIAEAVAAAEDGDEIHIKPGRYVENVAVVGKDLTISGDGDREDIVIELDPDGTAADFDWTPYADPEDGPPDPRAIILADTTSDVSNVTILAPHESEAINVLGADAEVTFREITVRSLGEIPGGISAVYFEHGGSGAVLESYIEGWMGLNDDATVVVEGNELPATCLGVWGQGADVVIRGNTIHGCEYEKGIEIEGGNTALVEGNEIWVEEVEPGPPNDDWGGREGIQVSGVGDGQVTIRDNDIHSSLVGMSLSGSVATEVSGNTVRDNQVGIATLSLDGVLSDNTITGNATDGLRITAGAPTVQGNTITGNGVGLSLGNSAEPMLEGNTICDNEQNISLNATVEPLDLIGNEVCQDEPAG